MSGVECSHEIKSNELKYVLASFFEYFLVLTWARMLNVFFTSSHMHMSLLLLINTTSVTNYKTFLKK